MAAPAIHQQHSFQRPNISNDRIIAIFQRINVLRSQGLTTESSPELNKLVTFARQLQVQQQQAQQHALNKSQRQDGFPLDHQPAINGHGGPTPGMNGPPAVNGHPLASGPLATQSFPNPPPSPVIFTPGQVNALRAQIHAFKLLQRGMPVPEQIQQIIASPNQPMPELDKILGSQDVATRVVDNTVKVHKGPGELPMPHIPPTSTPVQSRNDVKMEETAQAEELASDALAVEDVTSGVFPYNAYVHPFTYLKRLPDTTPSEYATRLQRMLIPSVMPGGLDPHQIIAERNRFLEARIQHRIDELEAMPATMGDGDLEPIVDDAPSENKGKEKAEPEPEKSLKVLNLQYVHPPATAHGKLRAMIELKSLRVLDKQRALRASVAERLTHGSLLPLNRPDFRRTRKPTLRDAHTTEQLERKQRVDRERRAKQKHVEQLNVITSHGQELLRANRLAQDRVLKLNKAVQSFHTQTEREEQKRIERISKERLKALKADDEEAYMKLIDTAKDTRITHLLKQTDSYLDSLAQAVVAQQTSHPQVGSNIIFEEEEGPTDERTFGGTVAPDDIHDDKGKVDYYAVAHRIKEKVTKQPGILVGGTLKEYQIKGLQWMVSLYNNRLNGILADEMGLGKTIQTISLITFLIETKRLRGPFLVIVPLSTMTNWSGEFAKWAPSVKVVAYKGNPAQRRALQGDLRVGQFQVLLTTYEYIIKDRPVLSKMKWQHMIIDEGHRMKNTRSKLALTLTTYYHSPYRLILTGTPLQNNLPELWALLNFALPKIFNSVKSFDEWFNTPFANSGTPDKIELNEEEALLIIRRLHKVLRPFLLRRLKKDVESELPDKVEKVVKIRMSALQSQLYKQMKKYKMIASGLDNKQGKQGGVKGLSNELMQLRKICQHPFLFESVEDKLNPSGLIDDKLIRSSGKIELLNRILPKFFDQGHRVLIFFQMTRVMDIMEDFLKMQNWKYLRLDGGTKTEERAAHVTAFNSKDSEIMVFILSTRAGGLGLNLQTADTVIIFDSDWNPHADLQAQDRAHRIGQTKAVRILRFITEKSVEEAMYSRARYKLDIDDKVIQAGRFDNKSTQEEQEEFLRSILEADQEEETEEGGDMNDDEINMLIARSEEEERRFGQMDIERERETAARWKAAGNRGKPPLPLMQLEELPDCYRTDEPFENKDELEEVEGRGQRKRNVVNYNDGLSDDQWAMALEEGEDVYELAERAREKKDRRTAKLRESESGVATPSSEGRGRGRKGKAKATEQDFDTPTNGKRKRNQIKQMSVTPSVPDDEEEKRDSKRRKKGADVKLSPAVKEKLKKAMNDCYKAIVNITDESGRKRCEMFKELPDKAEYPDYYQFIRQPVALSNIRKRINAGTYKTVTAFRDEVRLMFDNAMSYNLEGSWVYIDAQEMKTVFENVYVKVTAGSGLPGADPAPAAAAAEGSGSMDEALTPMDEDMHERPPPKKKGRNQVVVSDDEYLTPSE